MSTRTSSPVVGALTCVAVLLLAGGAYLSFRIIPRNGFSHDAAAYCNAGWPWVATDLVPASEEKSKENAAPLLRQAIAEFKMEDFGAKSRDILKQIDFGDLAGAEEALKPYQAAMDTAVQASRKSKLDFGRDWDQGLNVSLPEYGKTRSIVHALVCRAELEAHRGQKDRCISDIRAAWSLGSLVGQEPTLLAMLVQCALEGITLNSIERCAFVFRSDPASLDRLKLIISNRDDRPDLIRGLRGEAYLELASLRNLDALGGIDAVRSEEDGGHPNKIPSDSLVRDGLPSGQSGAFYRSAMFEFWIEVGDLAEKDGPRTKLFYDDLNSKREEVASLAKADTSRQFLDAMLPKLKASGEAVLKMDAWRDSMSALLAAMEIKAKSGHFPLTIAKIPGKWVDPFTGSPLRMRASGDSLRIYSVGPDEKDNSAKMQSEVPTSDQNFDVGACYPPRKRRAPADRTNT